MDRSTPGRGSDHGLSFVAGDQGRQVMPVFTAGRRPD